MARTLRAIEDGQDEQGSNGPARLCALTRTVMPKEEMVRFVRGPDGAVYPDPAAKLPGRGVWVTANHDRIAEAVKTGIFARSFKAGVKVPADLAEKVGDLLRRRALDFLSLANKAGLVITGFDKLDAALAKGSVAALLHAREASADGAQKLDRKYNAIARASHSKTRIVTLFTNKEMSLAMGRSNVVHAALKQGGATQRFLIEAGRIERYRPVSVEEVSKPDATGA